MSAGVSLRTLAPASEPGAPRLDARLPTGGPLSGAWARRKGELALVTRARRRSQTVVVVGSGLAGAAAAASLSELGHRVVCLCFQDSPRRAHSVAAQGGINACKNYQNDGDSVDRLFLDTLKGGDYRSREANVFRLAELSLSIIDQCVAQGVPFAREYGGHLRNRSFGGALVSRTFYARGLTGQQLLLGAYQALSKEVAAGGVQLLPRHEVLELIVHEGRARGVVARDLVTGEQKPIVAEAVVLASGGYSNVFFHSTNALGSNGTAIVRAYEQGAAFANPSFVQFHPTCVPPEGQPQGKLLLMSEALRNDGRVWVPKPAADQALDAAACIGCGACVAACPNASAALFIGAKVTHLALLPQGGLERRARALSLVAAADREGFGACTSYGECHAACPKGIGLGVITRLNREVLSGAS